MVRALSGEPTQAETVEPALPGPGTHVGRFLVVEAIGQGGMGVVFKAYDPALDRRVAVKLLRPGRGGSLDSGGAARLAREAQAMAQLAHPNVVPVYDVGRFGDALFVAMEFVSGATLHHWLAEKPRPWQAVLAVCLQAGRGLEAAHAAGLVHRDFKPANVLVGEDGRARVTDFGLARSSREEPRAAPPVTPALSLDTPLTQAGAVMGTPGYMAPEQYVGRASTPATDQYAFCVTLYEALYGRRPFEGADLPTLTRLTHAGQVPPAPKGSPVPAWLHALVVQGLAPVPEQRHPSMTVLLARLEADPSKRRQQWLRSAAAATLAVGAASAVWVWPTVRASSCHRETNELATVWSRSRQGVEQAFLRSGQAFAPSAWNSVRTSLDGFSEAWARERHQACEDTLRRGEQSPRQLALRLACLDRRRVELTTLVHQFETASPDVVAQAATAVTRLTPVARCSNVGALEKRAELSARGAAAADVIEQQLAEGRVMIALGDFARARPLITEATASARTLDDEATTALALLELGVLEREENHFPAARAALEEAVRRGLASGDERTALHAIALLASVTGWRLDEPRVGLAWVVMGRGLVARVDDPMLAALLDEGEGDARWRLGDPASLDAYRRALALFERAQGPEGVDVARMHSSIGWLLMERGALTEARDAFERSRRTREALLGADHPALGSTWNELAELARRLDDREGAVEASRRALQLRQATRGIDEQVPARASVNLARALLVAGRLDEAEEHLNVGVAVLDRSRPLNRAALERTTSELLFQRGDLAGAAAAARRALEGGYDEPTYIAELEGWLGHILAAAGDARGARVVLSRGVETYERLSPGSTESGLLAFDLARVVEQLEPPAAARPVAERALEKAVGLEGNARLKARAALLAARVRRAAGAADEAMDAARLAVSFASVANLPEVRAEAEALLARGP
jgi:serine/threonine protein kinase